MKGIGLLITSFLCIAMISSAQHTQVDGPYVAYRNGQVFVSYIMKDTSITSAATDSFPEAAKNSIELRVNTDEPGKTFTVKLKTALQPEPAETAMPAKQLVLSDIEGNFGAFRKLLQAAGVIDTALNWTFGNGHLVLTGDFVDRGEQVTEVLWLIYSLEEKAKAAGGQVHYVLGNHEIMIMSGDTRYVNPRYQLNVLLIGARAYEFLYDENTELGRWLRSKNIMEKVGENLFIHAGISPEVNDMRINVESMNTIARPYYADSIGKYPEKDKKLPLIFSDYGPFWYRGYYKKDPIADMQETVNNTLRKFKVKHIFTGHTIIGDAIGSYWNNKVINTDIHHADGKSEAVLIEGDQYYRVNNKGERIPLW
jgi:hypothetical protein